MRPRRQVHIHGVRGQWTAEVEGKQLAVLHNTWWQDRRSNRYHDPMQGVLREGARYLARIAALRMHDLAVMQRDGGPKMERDGYLGVFRFRNLVIGEDGAISLDLVERYADPKR